MHDADKMQDVRLSCFILAGWTQNLWQLGFQVPCRANIDSDAHWNQTFFQCSGKKKKKKEKVWSYICLTNCLVVYAAVMGVAFFQSASRFAKRIVAHYWLVSCQMKTDVVLLACHKPP